MAGWGFLVGTFLFSGSLYVLVLTGQKWLGAITPLGGVSFLIGWLALAVAASGPSRPSAPAAGSSAVIQVADRRCFP